MPPIRNFPDALNDEHHAWHQPGSHSQFPTRAIPFGQPDSGEEFLTFHRYFVGKFHSWYDYQQGVDLPTVYAWDEIPQELKSATLGWDNNLASAERRITNQLSSFGSADDLGRFVEDRSGIHSFLHSAGSRHFGDPLLATFHSPASSYFWNLHGLVDRWWWLWANQSTPWGVGDHFYTVSPAERDGALTDYGYSSEGIACYVFEAQAPGTIPLYRLSNPHVLSGDHFYTTSLAERDNAISTLGYNDDGVCCFVHGGPTPDTTPLYKLAHFYNWDHFYTMSVAERDDAIVSFLYMYNGVACHVYPFQAAGTAPLYRLLRDRGF